MAPRPKAPPNYMVSHQDHFVAKIHLDDKVVRDLESANPDLRNNARDTICTKFREAVESGPIGIYTVWKETGHLYVAWTHLVQPNPIRKL